MSEQEIITSCQAGDRSGFKTLVDRYASKLKGICLRYMRDEFMAQDVLQESFITIFRKIDTYKNKGSFEGWLSKVTVRCALQALRKKHKNIVYLDSNSDHYNLRIDAEVEMEMNQEDILNMIDALPDHYRIVFNLYVIEGYSHLEISKMLGIGESTSRAKLSRARKKIQEIYKSTMMSADRSIERKQKIPS